MEKHSVSQSENELKTSDLIGKIEEAATLSEFLVKNSGSFSETGVSDLIKRELKKSGMTKAALAKRSGMSEVYLYQILSQRRHPSRDLMLCMCIGLALPLEAAQTILLSGGFAKLYIKNRRDSIIMYGILHGKDTFEINDMLFAEHEQMLLH